MVLAPQMFRDIEYIVPRAFFEQNNLQVKTVSTKETSTGRFGFEVKNDLIFSKDNKKELESFDAIVFVGGLGSLDYQNNNFVEELTKTYVENKKVVGAICAAPRNLLKFGVLKNQKCTGNNWDNEFENLAKQNNANPQKELIVVSNNFVTAYGPEQSEEFAKEIIKFFN